MKKKLSAALASTMVLGTVPAAFAATPNFVDISGSYAQQQILQLVSEGIINGEDATHFNPTGTLTRAEAAKLIVTATGLKVDTTVSSSVYFTDVNGWAAPYVDAASQAGLFNGEGNGIFDPSAPLTREQAAVVLAKALGLKVDMSVLPSFTDTASISSWARPYVAAAQKAGLFNGNPDGSFGGQSPFTREQAAVVLVAFQKAYQAAQAAQAAMVSKVTISGNGTVGVGQSEKLTAVATDAAGNAVANAVYNWSVSGSGAVIDANGNFIASQAGTYAVTATVNGVSATANVVVYGTVTGAKLSAAQSTIVANGVYKDAITATLVDANGNPVSNFNGTVTINYVDSNGNATTPVGSQLVNSTTGQVVATNGSLTANVVNGVANFNVQATSSVGVTDNLKVMQVTQQGSNSAVQFNGVNVTSSTLAISTIAQVATSVQVKAPSAISDNLATQATVNALILDQSGSPMLAGSYPVTFTVSGPATVVGGTSSTSYNGVFTGNGSTTNTTAGVTITSQQGTNGVITVQAASSGLSTGTATITAVQTGTPTAIKLTANKTGFVEGNPITASNVSSYTVQTVDASGNPVSDAAIGTSGTGSVVVNVANGGSLEVGTISNNVVTNVAAPDSNGNVTIPLSSTGSATFAIYDLSTTASNAHAGTYTVSVSSTANGYNLAAQTNTYIETANTVGGLSASSPSSALNVLPSNPSQNYTFQLTDAYGNNVAQAGITVDVYPSEVANNGHTATLNGQSNVTSAAPLQLVTNSSGQVTAALAAQAYSGDSWVVKASVPTQSGITTALAATIGTVTGQQTNIVSSIPSTISESFTDGGNTVTTATAGDTVSLVLTAKDQYGNTSSVNDTIKVTLPAQLSGGTGAPSGSTMDSGSSWSQYGTNVIDVPLMSGTATVNLTASKAGTGTITTSDLNTAVAVSGSAALTVNAITANSVALFYNGALTTSFNVSANSPIAFVVTPVDGQMNPGVSTSTTTYNLSDGGNGGTFSLTQGGAPVTQVTLPINSTGVTVYYTNAKANSSEPLSVSVAPVTVALTGSPSTVGAASFTVQSYGQQLNGTYLVTMTGAGTPTNAPATVPTQPTDLAVTFSNGVATIPSTAATITKAGPQNLTVSVFNAVSNGNGGYNQGTLVATSALDAINPTAGALASATMTIATNTLSEGTPGSTSAPVLAGNDQYGNAVTPTGGTFTLVPPTGANADGKVTIAANGVVTVAAGAAAADQGTYTVKYTQGTVVATATVTVGA